MSTTTSREMSPELRELIAPGTFIGGRWRDGGGELPVLDPATEEVLINVPEVGAATVEEAVAAARRAFDEGPWPRMSPRERSRIMARLAEGVAAHAQPLAELGVFEIGSPITLSRALHAAGPIQFLEYWADMALQGPHGRYRRASG